MRRWIWVVVGLLVLGSAEASSFTVFLKDGSILENVAITAIDTDAKQFAIRYDNKDSLIQFHQLKRIESSGGTDVTSEVLLGRLPLIVEAQQSDAETRASQPVAFDPWVGEDSWDDDFGRPVRPFRVGFELSGFGWIPSGDWYSGLGGGFGGSALVHFSLSRKYSIGVQVDIAGGSVSDEVRFAGTMSGLPDDWTFSIRHYFVFFQESYFTSWRYNGSLSHLYSRIGIGANVDRLSLGGLTASETRVALYGALGYRFSLGRSTGISIGVTASFIPFESDVTNQLEEALQFGLSVGYSYMMR